MRSGLYSVPTGRRRLQRGTALLHRTREIESGLGCSQPGFGAAQPDSRSLLPSGQAHRPQALGWARIRKDAMNREFTTSLAIPGSFLVPLGFSRRDWLITLARPAGRSCWCRGRLEPFGCHAGIAPAEDPRLSTAHNKASPWVSSCTPVRNDPLVIAEPRSLDGVRPILSGTIPFP